MNVFYFSSDLFASVVAVSMVSLLENNKEQEKITFYIVDDGISDEKKILLNNMVVQYESDNIKRDVVYLEALVPEILLKYPFKDRYQIGHSYFRMCIGTILPESVDRVLCLDSDTLICGNLSELWNVDMKGNILAGVSDCMNIMKYKHQFHMNKNDLYCNAGMYLVDLKKWREEKVEDKIIKRIHEQNGNVFFFEQTLMNWSCSGKILQLPPKYNAYTLFWAFTYKNLICWRKPNAFYLESEVEEAKDNPIIIHFTRNFYMLSRPWIKGCDHPKTKEYVKYKLLTPWKQLEEDNRSKKSIRRYKLWHIIPQRILAIGAGVIYNEVRPKLWWKNE